MANIRNGAKGISELALTPLFLDNLLLTIINMLYAAPIQKANTTAFKPEESPINAPIPKTSLASPNPIQRPDDTSHNKANGVNKIRGADKSR